MSLSEIQYLVPEANRPQGDTEAILMAIGAFQDEIPIHIPQEAFVAEEKNGAVMVKLVRTSLKAKPHYELLEESEKMRKGVEKHFSDEDRARLSRHFVGIAIAGATETE